MSWQWNPLALIPLAAVSLSFGIGWVVFKAAPGRTQNRSLAIMLLAQGLAVATLGLRLLAADVATSYGLYMAWLEVWSLALAATVVFYGTLPGPVGRTLRRPVVRWGSAAVPAGIAVLVLARPEWVLDSMRHTEGLDVWIASGIEPLWWVFVACVTLVMLAGVPATWVARRHAASQLERGKLNVLAAAFITYNIATALIIVRIMTSSALAGGSDPFIELLNFGGLPAAQFLLVAVLAYGILKTQLFDIELRLKWTIRQGTVTAIIVSTGFTVSELAAFVFSEQVGPVLGIIAAGTLVFAISPLERLAERVSDRAMPNVADTQEYRARRARELYASALETAFSDGTISDDERSMLALMQEKLELGATEALAMEREMAAQIDGAGS